MITQRRRCILQAAAVYTSILSRSASSMSLSSCKSIVVRGGGESSTNGIFSPRDPALVPAGFDRTCRSMRWDTDAMWKRLSDGKRPWFEADNESYVYWNRGDGKWWIDGPSGAGVYIVESAEEMPPKSGWIALPGGKLPVPTLDVVDD